MSRNLLIRSLLGFFRVAFLFTLLFLLLSLGLEVFTKDGRIGPVSGTHHSNGYALPVKLQLTLNDSIVSYKTEKSNGSVHYSKGPAGYGLAYSKFDSLLKQPNVVSKSVNKNIIEIKSRDDFSYYTLSNSSIHSDTFIYVKTKSLWLEILLFTKSYIALVLTVLIFYFLKSIFKILKSDSGFGSQLSQKVKILGIILTLGVVLKLTLSIVFYFYLNVITVFSSIDNEIISNPTQVLIHPRLDFNLSMLLIGLSLIILSTILKKGSQIQEENDLTI
ncbi:DUF2975 domain-containing protein [Winogradskyella forsetii]|uniref:DUF2975 domain-containing protein n=1 Tax=Winogradskyella forsetii TaxID=2686077 RepID=UPI0015BEE187|nr:DUF2975 domain-containing protein [Winogradskyella forsetii]